MRLISEMVSERLKKQSPYTERFLAIVDALQEIKREEVEKFRLLKLFGMVVDVEVLRRWCLGWFVGEVYEHEDWRYYYGFKERAYSIFSKKGRKEALVEVLECFFFPVMGVGSVIEVSDLGMPKPALLLNDWKPYDWLPEGVDIKEEMDGGKFVPTLIDRTWEDFKHSLEVRVKDPVIEHEGLLKLGEEVVVKFLPMVSREFITLEIKYV